MPGSGPAGIANGQLFLDCYTQVETNEKRIDMKKSISTIIMLLCLTFAVPSVAGQLFKWVDEQGNIHYGDHPPQNANLESITGKISSYGKVSVQPLPGEPKNDNKPAASAKSVIMYSTSWCGFCKKAKSHFRSNNIPFKEYDIEKSPSAAKKFKQLGGRGVPVILIGKQRMNGFDASTFDRIYHGNS